MDTERARELLPWLLNGSLEEPERGEVLDTLRTSDELRRELAETRLAGDVFGQHVPAADLVAHAFGEPTGLGRGRIEAHLALCESCAEELAMARESRELAEEPEAGTDSVPTGEERRPGRLLAFLRPSTSAGGGVAAGWQTAALAASVAAAVALGGWIWTWQQAQGRIGDLVASVRETEPPASGREAGTTGLIGDVLRSAGDRCNGPNCLALEARRGFAILYLPEVEATSKDIYELRLRPAGDGGQETLRLKPVAATPGSHLEFRPPANLLEAGQYSAELVRLGGRGWEQVASYPLTVVYEGR